jgi:DNA-binding CsgD family transcriptional regulator
MSATTIIAAIDALNVEIKSHQDEIDRLVTARDTLGTLVSTDEAKPIRKGQIRAVKVTEGPVIATGKIVDDEEGTLAKDLADSIIEGASKSTGDSPTPRRRRRKMNSEEAGEAFVKSAVKQATRKSTKSGNGQARKQNLANLEKARAAKTSKSNGKATRRDQIIALLNKGKTPQQIGDTLGIAPNYVYHVKRSIA